MSEPKYPRVFGFWSERSGRFTDDMRTRRSDADEERNSDETVVELIPLPEHEAIVAAAVAAAVERCAGIADGLEEWIAKPGETESQAIVRTITEKIREVPK